MNRQYFYDIECSHTFFGVTFIPVEVSDEWVTNYISIDTAQVALRKTIEGDPYLNPEYEAINVKKRTLIQEVGGRRFLLLKDDVRQLPNLLLFLSHTNTYIGFNSYNYDSLMLDYLIIKAPDVHSDGFFSETLTSFTKALSLFSDKLIQHGSNYSFVFRNEHPNYSRTYTDYDIRKILHLDQTFTSLKQISIILCWYKVEDYDFNYIRKLEAQYEWDFTPIVNIPVLMNAIRDCMWYNINDVLITRLLYFHEYEEVKLREGMSNKFKVNVRNDSRSSSAVKIMKSKYCEKLKIPVRQFPKEGTSRGVISFSSVIFDKIKFKTPKLQKFLDDLRKYRLRLGSDKFSISILLNTTKYQLGRGGIHSKDKGIEYLETAEFEYIDVDVNSWYPFLLTYYKLCPAHLNAKAFIEVLDDMMKGRLVAKAKSKQKYVYSPELLLEFAVEADGMKITINAVGGKLGEFKGIFEDLLTFYQMTVNGQLFLLMLAEAFELSGIQVVSANTDGLTCKVPVASKDRYYEIVDNWKQYVGCEVEFAKYEAYYRRDVNNYIAVKKGFRSIVNDIAKYDSILFLKNENPRLFANCNSIEDCYLAAEKEYVKFKGCFLQESSISKGYSELIVPIALKRYFLYDIDVFHTIKGDRQIYNFCRAQKINRSFELAELVYDDLEHELEELGIQKDTRYFVSTKGSLLVKFKSDTINKTRKKHSVAANVYVTTFNLYEAKPFAEYNINYNFYIARCKTIIKEVRYNNEFNRIPL